MNLRKLLIQTSALVVILPTPFALAQSINPFPLDPGKAAHEAPAAQEPVVAEQPLEDLPKPLIEIDAVPEQEPQAQLQEEPQEQAREEISVGRSGLAPPPEPLHLRMMDTAPPVSGEEDYSAMAERQTSEGIVQEQEEVLNEIEPVPMQNIEVEDVQIGGEVPAPNGRRENAAIDERVYDEKFVSSPRREESIGDVPQDAPKQLLNDGAPQEEIVREEIVEEIVMEEAFQEAAPEAVIQEQPRPVKAAANAWTAQDGEDIRDVLARWSNAADVNLIWNSELQFAVLEPVSVGSTYESAVSVLLGQYKGNPDRPYGVLNVEPDTGGRTLTIDNGG